MGSASFCRSSARRAGKRKHNGNGKLNTQQHTGLLSQHFIHKNESRFRACAEHHNWDRNHRYAELMIMEQI
jgi:hypothetical protein